MLGRMPDVVTVEEAADALGYHPESVRQLIRRGRLNARKAGTMWLIPAEALRAYQQAIQGKSKHDPTRGD